MVLQPAFLGCPAHFLSMTGQVRTSKGVRYVPLKVLRDLERQSLSASCLLKEMKYNKYKKFKPIDTGTSVRSGDGTCLGEYMVLDEFSFSELNFCHFFGSRDYFPHLPIEHSPHSPHFSFFPIL